MAYQLLEVMPNPLYRYSLTSFVGFYDISTIVGYLIPNPLNRYLLNSFVGFYDISTIVGYLVSNSFYSYIKHILYITFEKI